MQASVRDLLDRRMKRTIGRVLRMKEREVDPYLPDDVARRYRSLILAELNRCFRLTMDVVDHIDDGTVVLNEDYLQMLERMYRDARVEEPVPAGD